MEEVDNNNYIGAEELNNIYGDSDKDMQRFFNELLFCVQEVGKKKIVEGVEVFVKSKHCDESLKDVYKFLRNENPINPIIRRELGKWNFVEESLLPLLISQKKDKKLSFLTVLLLAELTYLPEKEAVNRELLIENLRTIKQSFLAPGA